MRTVRSDLTVTELRTLVRSLVAYGYEIDRRGYVYRRIGISDRHVGTLEWGGISVVEDPKVDAARQDVERIALYLGRPNLDYVVNRARESYVPPL